MSALCEHTCFTTIWYSQEQHKGVDRPKAFGERGPLIAELTVAATTGDIAQTTRQTEALKEACSCFEVLKKVSQQ